MARSAAPLVFLAALAACGGSDPAPPVSGSNDAFTPAVHAPLPAVELHGGPVFTSPQVVTITWANDSFREQLEQFGAFVVGSSWLRETGSDYGVGPGTLLANVRLAENAPATINDQGIFDELDRRVASGELPAPSAANPQIVYLFYFPSSTQVTDPDGDVLCSGKALAYHGGGTASSIPFAYGVIPDCHGSLNELTVASTHELLESITDPVGGKGWFLDVAPADPWSGVNGFEVADLCPNEIPVQEQGFLLSRGWSNSAAAAGGSPCVPVPAGETFVDVAVTNPPSVPEVAPGDSATFTLTGWSTADVAPWPLSLAKSPVSDFAPLVSLSSSTVGNGGTVQLTLQVPPGTPPGKLGAVLVLSGDNGGMQPVTIRSR